MTLDNFMNRIWLRFIKFIHYMTLHFLEENGLCRLRYGKDGLNLCPTIQGKQTSASNFLK